MVGSVVVPRFAFLCASGRDGGQPGSMAHPSTAAAHHDRDGSSVGRPQPGNHRLLSTEKSPLKHALR